MENKLQLEIINSTMRTLYDLLEFDCLADLAVRINQNSRNKVSPLSEEFPVADDNEIEESNHSSGKTLIDLSRQRLEMISK